MSLVPSALRICFVVLAVVVSSANAQLRIELSNRPNSYSAPNHFKSPTEEDEARLVRQVLASARWKAFVEVLNQGFELNFERGEIEDACRRSVRLARLMSVDLLVDDCIADALRRVDPTSTYVPPLRYSSQLREARRPRGAVGLSFFAQRRVGDPVVVASVFEGRPAAKAGVVVGDVIESIDGTDLALLSPEDHIDRLRGEPGTTAVMQIRRQEEALKILVQREAVKDPAVGGRWLNSEVLYLRIWQFRDGQTTKELLSALNSSTDMLDRPKLWILDIRGASGGSPSEMAAAASLFLAKGEALFKISSREGLSSMVATPPSFPTISEEMVMLLKSVPLAVLVDRGTAAGSETFAQVLRARRQAKIAGEATAKIDSVVKEFDLRGEALVRLTTGRILSVTGQRQNLTELPLDLVLPATPNTEIGKLPNDALLSTALVQFAK